MIHIIKKSKKTPQFERINLSLSEAKKFLYELETKDFRTKKVIVFGSDKKSELNEILDYFNKEYLTEESTEGFSAIYVVNENVKKYHRLSTNGASITALKKFKRKIEKAIPESNVVLAFNNDSFDLMLTHPTGDVKLICDYNLTILKSYASNKEGEFVDIEKNDTMIKIINDIFRKQRYYYKKRKGAR